MGARYFYGHNIAAAGFLVQALCIGAMFTYGVFFKQFEADFGWSRAMVSGASSLAFLVMGAGGVLAGSLNDRIGPRPILTVAGISLGAGYLLMSRMDAPWQLYLLYGLLVGAGFSTHDVVTLSTLARWFVQRRGTMTGIVKVGTGCGQLLGPLAAAALIEAVGWRRAYLVIGAVSMAALVAAAQWMRRDPRQLGLAPDGASGHGTAAGPPAAEGMPLSDALRDARFWVLCLVGFAVFFCMLSVVVHIYPHARDRGLAPPAAAGVLSAIGGVSIAGRLVMGAVNDRIGGKRSLVVCFTVLVSAMLWLQLAPGGRALFVFAVVYGFAHGGFFTVLSPFVAELFGTAAHGVLFGAVLFSGTLGGALGPLVAGWLFDAGGSYDLAFVLLTAFAAGGFCLVAFLRPKRPRPAAAAHRGRA